MMLLKKVVKWLRERNDFVLKKDWETASFTMKFLLLQDKGKDFKILERVRFQDALRVKILR